MANAFDSGQSGLEPENMLFALTCLDNPNSTGKRAENRPAHVEYLEQHKDQIVMAGPLTTDDGQISVGSLLILDMPNREAVIAFAENDPYAKAGLFNSVAISAWRQVFPKKEG